MKTKEIPDGDVVESAEFEYEFEKRELWNFGHNLNKIVLAGLKQYKDVAMGFIDAPEMFKDIDEIIANLEFVVTNEFEFVDVSKEVKRAYELLGNNVVRMWY